MFQEILELNRLACNVGKLEQGRLFSHLLRFVYDARLDEFVDPLLICLRNFRSSRLLEFRLQSFKALLQGGWLLCRGFRSSLISSSLFLSGLLRCSFRSGLVSSGLFLGSLLRCGFCSSFVGSSLFLGGLLRCGFCSSLVGGGLFLSGLLRCSFRSGLVGGGLSLAAFCAAASAAALIGGGLFLGSLLRCGFRSGLISSGLFLGGFLCRGLRRPLWSAAACSSAAFCAAPPQPP